MFGFWGERRLVWYLEGFQFEGNEQMEYSWG